jgi:hypothetical protein
VAEITAYMTREIIRFSMSSSPFYKAWMEVSSNSRDLGIARSNALGMPGLPVEG